MKTTLKKSLGIAALLALTAVPASAHRFWIIPSTSVLSGDDQWVAFDAAISGQGLLLAILVDLKIIHTEAGNGLAVLVGHGNVDAYEIGCNPHNLIVGRRRYRLLSKVRRTQQHCHGT